MNKDDWFKKFSDGYMLDSGIKGPTSVIMAGTHGNEVCGIEAFYKIVPTLGIKKGKVYFIFGNPKAIEDKIRQTEYNLNRCFRASHFYTKAEKKTYEYRRAQYLKKILTKCDFLLDIHSTTNPGSKPFIICTQRGHKIAKSFSKKFVREVWGFGGIEPGATEDFMEEKGKIGITIECGQHNDPKSIILAEKTILDFLGINGHLAESKKTNDIKRLIYKVEKLYKNKSNEFKLAKQFVDFSPIKKKTFIGIDGDQKIYSDRNGVIVFAHNTKKQNEEAFILGRKIK